MISITINGTTYENWEYTDLCTALSKKAVDKAIEDGKMKALISERIQQKELLLAKLTEKIAPLQDAVELEVATTDEENQLKELKKQRIDINRIDVNDVSVKFPDL